MSEGARIRQFMMGATREQASLVTRALSLRTLAGVVMKTPVDTGRARGAWNVSLGQASGSSDAPEDRGGASTISRGSSIIGQQRGYVQVVLENNVPYIGKLEDGSSKQAPGPGGIVDITIASLGLAPGRES